ncbi:MAG: GDSL-type esterase/lipase family protein [Erysipelotrichaceae bacterium]
MKKTISMILLVTTMIFGSVLTNVKASEKVDFVAIGDSITTGYGLPGYDKTQPFASESFVELLQKNKSFHTTNLGVDGLNSLGLASLSNPKTLSEAQQTVIKEANVISITIGGNDLLGRFMGDVAAMFSVDINDKTAMAAAIGNPSNAGGILIILNTIGTHISNIVDEFSTNLTTTITNIKTMNPTAKIIVQTIANPYKEYTNPVLVTAIDDGLSALNQAINLGATKGAYVVGDVYQVFNDSTQTNLTNAMNPTTPLDPHPTAAGHALIADVVFGAMHDMFSLLKKEPTAILPILNIENGSQKSVEGLKLPTYTMIDTTKGEQKANIVWDLKNCKYDPTLKTAQEFDVTGVVVMPKFALNDDNLSLKVTTKVSVNKAKDEIKKEVITTPNTGDDTSIFTLGIIGLLAFGTMLVVKRKESIES